MMWEMRELGREMRGREDGERERTLNRVLARE